MQQLHAFFQDESSSRFQLLGELNLGSERLEIRYKVQGPISELRMPLAVENPQFRDELWQFTCFEVFLQRAGEAAYEEWNFGPSGHWACYQFDSYRQLAREQNRKNLSKEITTNRQDHQLLLSVSIPFENQSELTAANLRFGLSAILQLQNGEKIYWAQTHAADKPDFHQAASFTARLIP